MIELATTPRGGRNSSEMLGRREKREGEGWITYSSSFVISSQSFFWRCISNFCNRFLSANFRAFSSFGSSLFAILSNFCFDPKPAGGKRYENKFKEIGRVGEGTYLYQILQFSFPLFPHVSEQAISCVLHPNRSWEENS